jgi:hypothetical protein
MTVLDGTCFRPSHAPAKDVANAKAMLAGKAKRRNGGGIPRARPQNGAARPDQRPDKCVYVHEIATAKVADQSGRMTLVGLKAAAAARKARVG